MKIWHYIIAALLGLACGCGPKGNKVEQETKGEGLYDIVTTTGMVGDIVRVIAGDQATVINLIGDGVDPHLYKPTRHDVAALSHADLVFYSGLYLEGKMDSAFKAIQAKGKPVYAVTELIDPAFLIYPEGQEEHPDPHVWMDVQGWMATLAVVADALADYDPEHAAEYRGRAETFRQEMATLDHYIKNTLKTIPEDRRVMVTAHDAFNYFGRAYGLEVMGIQGISTESEAGIQDINRLVDLLVERKVPAVFVESTVAVKNVKALIEGARSRGHEVRIGGELFSDAMGASGTYRGTYIGMLDHNATTVAGALGADAAPGGFQGKLSHD